MRASVARIKNPVLEVLLFRVAGVEYGVELGQVVGLVHDLPNQRTAPVGGDPHLMLFEGRHVPVFPADDFMRDVGPPSVCPREAIIFDDGGGYYGMAVDGTGAVVEVTVGDDLYVFPPQEVTDESPCRPWGWLAAGDKPVLLLDMSRVLVH
jgi:hypothetical protein